MIIKKLVIYPEEEKFTIVCESQTITRLCKCVFERSIQLIIGIAIRDIIQISANDNWRIALRDLFYQYSDLF